MLKRSHTIWVQSKFNKWERFLCIPCAGYHFHYDVVIPRVFLAHDVGLRYDLRGTKILHETLLGSSKKVSHLVCNVFVVFRIDQKDVVTSRRILVEQAKSHCSNDVFSLIKFNIPKTIKIQNQRHRGICCHKMLMSTI